MNNSERVLEELRTMDFRIGTIESKCGCKVKFKENVEQRLKALEAKEIMCTCPDHKEPHKHNVPPNWTPCQGCGILTNYRVCASCFNKEMKAKQPAKVEPCVHSRCAYSIISGVTVWTCSDCYASWINDDIIQIPRQIAEEVIRTKANLPNELYDAIKKSLGNA